MKINFLNYIRSYIKYFNNLAEYTVLDIFYNFNNIRYYFLIILYILYEPRGAAVQELKDKNYNIYIKDLK